MKIKKNNSNVNYSNCSNLLLSYPSSNSSISSNALSFSSNISNDLFLNLSSNISNHILSNLSSNYQNMSKLKSNIIPNSYISLKTSENLNNNFNDNEMEDVKYDKLTKKTYNTSSHAWSERIKIQREIVNKVTLIFLFSVLFIPNEHK